MTETLRLGTVAGIRVGLHWSVLGIVVLLVLGLAGELLPARFPDEPVLVYVAGAIAATVLFVLSLLAHELGHAVIARRNGIGVDGITLWLLGGVARLRGDARDAASDFRVAAIGPVVSFVLGLVFVITTWASVTADAPELVAGVLSYLAAINIVLAVFNLIPAAPLDGGRILRSLLWAWRGDRFRAHVWSARAGRVFGLVLIALGLFWLFNDYAGGLWWILIGLFVVTMASAEEQHARTGAALGRLRARDIMTPDPDVADAAATVSDFVRDVLLIRRHSAFPLVDDADQVQGLVTLNRIRAVPRERHEQTRVAEVACPREELVFAHPDELVSDVVGRLGGCADGRALVMEGEQLVGIISPTDVSRAMSLSDLGIEPAGGSDLSYRRMPDQHR